MIHVTKENGIKHYKVFNKDLKCNGMQYEIGKDYHLQDNNGIPILPIVCKQGFHACLNINNCWEYYKFTPVNRVCRVLLYNHIDDTEEDKNCSSSISILEEISWEQVLQLCNSGHYNSGHCNSGNENSGNKNSGNMNSGNRNSGDMNSGNWNSGNKNSGDGNSGYWNSGDMNSGNWNSGHYNSGHFNTISPLYVFNKSCDRTTWDNTIKPNFIYFSLNKEETLKEGWQRAFKTATAKDIVLLKALPNFNKDIFFEISGIMIE